MCVEKCIELDIISQRETFEDKLGDTGKRLDTESLSDWQLRTPECVLIEQRW